MYEHFEQRFPEQRAAINLLARFNAVLRTVLADYEEINTWLAAQKSPEPPDPDELKRARALARELEHEILNYLETQDDNTN